MTATGYSEDRVAEGISPLDLASGRGNRLGWVWEAVVPRVQN
jgi:hypothetical protein